MSPTPLSKAIGITVFLSCSLALAEPKICGDQDALGASDPTRCPVLKDDGVPPDDVAGDGIYTLEVQLVAAPFVKYKLLPNGSYDGSETGEIGTCGPTGPGQSGYRDLLLPNPDVSKKTRFYYDSRDLSGDATYAPAPNNRSFGDTVMAYAPTDAKPGWTVVGDVPGAPLDMSEVLPGVFVAQTLLAKDIPAGWKWKVQEKGTGTGTGDMGAAVLRQYRPEGWSYTPCKGMVDDVTVATAAPAGQMLHLYFYAYTGRMQTVIGELPDMAGQADMSQPKPDLSSPPDLSRPLPDLQQGGVADLVQTVGMEVPPGKLPGCHCQMGTQAGGPGAGQVPALGVGLLLLAGLLRRRAGAGGTSVASPRSAGAAASAMKIGQGAGPVSKSA